VNRLVPVSLLSHPYQVIGGGYHERSVGGANSHIYRSLVSLTNDLLNVYSFVSVRLPTQEGSDNKVSVEIHFVQLCSIIIKNKTFYLTQVFWSGYNY
jgi:hypothetical protein